MSEEAAGREAHDAERPVLAPAHEPSRPRSSAELEIVEQLHGLLALAEDPVRLDAEIARLAAASGAAVYSELIYLMCHLRFDEPTAVAHWRRVGQHREQLQRSVGSPVDLRVALLSYFVQVNRQLENPMVIELKLFELTQASAYRDELTGLPNYRYFLESLTRELARAERSRAPLSLVMLDVDGFKDFNDTRGHEAGNRVLAGIAEVLRESLRKLDVPARYGGEEFAVILAGTPKEDAELVAERVRRAIEAQPFEVVDGEAASHVTVSLGLATYPGDATHQDELIRRADRAMYVAKSRGRNRVELYEGNRRSHRRVDVRLEGSYRQVAGDACPLRTVRVSEGGIRFVSEGRPEVGALLELRLTLPEVRDDVVACARVVRVEPADEDGYATAARILSLATEDRALLAGYLRRRDDRPR